MSTPDFKLSQISIVMLGTKDLARSIEFYRDRLGLEIRNQTPGFVFFNTGSIVLCLNEPLARVAGDAMNGATEIVFPVDHVRAGYEALQAKGVVFTHEPRNVYGQSWAANFKDPDGHQLSIFGNE
jgi:lactoylglutathione lyase